MSSNNRKREKYYLILDAALRVFAEHGYHKSQVARIAREAGVADGTIYLYFNRKEDILIELFQYRLTDLANRISASIEQAADVKEALRKFCELHYTEMQNDIHFAHLTQLELRQNSMELRKAIGKAFKPYLILFENLLVRGINENVFRPDINVKLARHLLFGAMDEVVTSWLISGQKYSLTAQAGGTYNFFLQGIEK